MQSPQAFLEEILKARNQLFARHQKELENFQLEFCKGSLFYDKRLRGYLDEKIVDVERSGPDAVIRTDGYITGKNQSPMRYILRAEDDIWFLFDMQFRCAICKGSGVFKCKGAKCENSVLDDNQCKYCKGTGWCSLKKSADDFFAD